MGKADMGKYWGKDVSRTVLPATNLGPKPGDFPLRSLESRAAARAMVEHTGEESQFVIFTGLPTPFSCKPIVELPDTIAHYEAADGSIAEVIRREYAPAEFTVFIKQTWKDGSVYQGSYVLRDLPVSDKRFRSIPLQPSVWREGADDGSHA